MAGRAELGRLSPGDWDGRPVAVTGGAGFLGTALVALLSERGADVRVVRSSAHDLREPSAAISALDGADVVFHLAANVGGIGYNRRHPAALAHDNLAMATNVYDACWRLGTGRLVAACSVCAYPKHTPTPFREDELWSGYPEESNAPYGLAKKMLLVLGQGYAAERGLDSAVPVIANLYGPHDNFDLEDSHVVPAMIRKYIEARDDGDRPVTLWGSGRPSREFLFVADAARALLACAEAGPGPLPINIGTGRETSIAELAETISELTGFSGETVWDPTSPDGQPRRYLEVSRARELLGFEAQTDLREGLGQTIRWYERNAGGRAALDRGGPSGSTG